MVLCEWQSFFTVIGWEQATFHLQATIIFFFIFTSVQIKAYAFIIFSVIE